MKLIRKISNAVFALEKGLAILLVSMMFISLTTGVIFRYFLKLPLHWADETAIFSLVWLTFIGGSMSIKQGQLAAVTMFTNRFSERIRNLFLCVSNTLVLIFGILFLIISIKWIFQPTIGFQKSPIMQIPMIYPYLSVPIGLLFLCIHSLHSFMETVIAVRQTETASKAEKMNALPDEVM